MQVHQNRRRVFGAVPPQRVPGPPILSEAKITELVEQAAATGKEYIKKLQEELEQKEGAIKEMEKACGWSSKLVPSAKCNRLKKELRNLGRQVKETKERMAEAENLSTKMGMDLHYEKTR